MSLNWLSLGAFLAVCGIGSVAQADEISKWESSVSVEGPDELLARNGVGIVAPSDQSRPSYWYFGAFYKEYTGTCFALSPQRSMPYAGEIVAQVSLYDLWALLPDGFKGDLFKINIQGTKLSTGQNETLLSRAVTPKDMDMFDFEPKNDSPFHNWFNKSYQSAPIELRLTTSEPTSDVQIKFCDVTPNTEIFKYQSPGSKVGQYIWYLQGISIFKVTLELRKAL
jgi:hypothetical protein